MIEDVEHIRGREIENEWKNCKLQVGKERDFLTETFVNNSKIAFYYHWMISIASYSGSKS